MKNIDNHRAAINDDKNKLDEFSQLPDDLCIASTEMGLLCALNQNKMVIDLAGLQETEIAQKGFNANKIINQYKPDLIYIPNPDYVEMINDIKSSDIFNNNYTLYDYGCLGDVKLEIAIKKDSKHYNEMKAILENR